MCLYSSLGVIIRWCETVKWGRLHNPLGVICHSCLCGQVKWGFTIHCKQWVVTGSQAKWVYNLLLVSAVCLWSFQVSVDIYLYWAPLMWPKLTGLVVGSVFGAISKSACKAANRNCGYCMSCVVYKILHKHCCPLFGYISSEKAFVRTIPSNFWADPLCDPQDIPLLLGFTGGPSYPAGRNS